MSGKKRGSLTVEAVISFTVFIMVMFLLLTLVKLVLMMTVLNNATVETAKIIATSAYPISFLNEAQSGLEDMEDNLKPTTLASSIVGTGQSAVVSDLLGGDPDTVLKSGFSSICKGLVGGTAVKLLKGAVYEIKGNTVNYLCGKLIQGYVENCGLRFDPEKLTLRVAKIPETEAEFEHLHTGSLSLSEDGSLTASPASSASGTDGNFNAEDVVLCLEYPYELALPFLPSFTITLRSDSVEHAWLTGTSEGPERTEGIDLSNLLFGKEKRVWIPTGGNGKRYHTKDCHLLWSSKIETTVNSAKKQGFTACKICKPDGEPGKN